MTEAEYRKLDRLLARLDDCDLSEWDRDFVDDMIRRVGEYEEKTVVTGKQQAQLNRMEDQYLMTEAGHNSGATEEELAELIGEDAEEPESEGPTVNIGGIAGERLRSFVQRVERLEEEKKSIADDIKEVYAEAKSQGFDPKIMRKVVRLRAIDAASRKEEEALLETYLHALGMLDA